MAADGVHVLLIVNTRLSMAIFSLHALKDLGSPPCLPAFLSTVSTVVVI